MLFLSAHPNDPRYPEFEHVFGDLEKLAGSQHDPATWLKQGAQNPARLPRLYLSCGRQDDLYPINQQFHLACQSLGIPVDYHAEDGFHDWFFWNAHIQRFLAANLHPV